ncbi:hypothetical protein [Methylobacterium currus]|uniref:hypothetical protein n=1 Tax=Methylobacterium currus TaxID=2051553 RepID=UPI000F516A0D|nr:hypothetical protein [Methylobacterium currus]
MTSLSAHSSLTSLARLKTYSSIPSADTKRATTGSTAPPETTSSSETPKPPSSTPMSVVWSRAPADRVSLSTILTLQTSAPDEKPKDVGSDEASTQARTDGDVAGASPDSSKGRVAPGATGGLGSLKEADSAGEGANLRNASNRDAIGSPAHALAYQSAQSLLKLYA